MHNKCPSCQVIMSPTSKPRLCEKCALKGELALAGDNKCKSKNSSEMDVSYKAGDVIVKMSGTILPPEFEMKSAHEGFKCGPLVIPEFTDKPE